MTPYTLMILHIDMDAFYAAIEERDNPDLRGKPLVVGGDPRGRGVVAAANYAARQFGVHSAMPASQALRLCPKLVILRGRHAYYAQISQQIRDIFLRYTPLVEPLSLDEAFLDVTHSRELFGTTQQIGQRIKQEISQELQLTASVGVARNKFIAKIASDMNKPDGFMFVHPGTEQDFLDPLPVSRLWGVGKTSNKTLQRLGIQTIAQLRQLPQHLLRELFGKWGDRLWELANGIDQRPVVPDHEAKSISHETTFDTDISDLEILRACLLELTGQVAWRMRRNDLRGRTVRIKLRYADFKTVTRTQSLPLASDITQELWHVAQALLLRHLAARHSGLRLIGVGVSGFERGAPHQANLFDDPTRRKYGHIDAISDDINARFGSKALHRASDLKR